MTNPTNLNSCHFHLAIWATTGTQSEFWLLLYIAEHLHYTDILTWHISWMGFKVWNGICTEWRSTILQDHFECSKKTAFAYHVEVLLVPYSLQVSYGVTSLLCGCTFPEAHAQLCKARDGHIDFACWSRQPYTEQPTCEQICQCKSIINAMHKAYDEMSWCKDFKHILEHMAQFHFNE